MEMGMNQDSWCSVLESSEPVFVLKASFLSRNGQREVVYSFYIYISTVNSNARPVSVEN